MTIFTLPCGCSADDDLDNATGMIAECSYVTELKAKVAKGELDIRGLAFLVIQHSIQQNYQQQAEEN